MSVVIASTTGMSFLRTVYARTYPVALKIVNGASMHEMLRLFDQIDRNDLAAIASTLPCVRWTVNSERIQFAISVVTTRKVPISGAEKDDFRVANVFLFARNPIQIPADPTATLPAPTSSQPAMTAEDFEQIGRQVGCEAAAVRAVATVESGGRSGFASDGRPVIRYELHCFNKFTKGAYAKTHPHLARVYSRATLNIGHVGQAAEWSMFYGALMLRGSGNAGEHVFASCSWGMYQVMGFNHKTLGYPNARAVGEKCFQSARAHTEAFLAYCQGAGLIQHLKNKNWAAFAKAYNGSDYATNHYDTNLAKYYERFKK